jgi:hypothetical protein
MTTDGDAGTAYCTGLKILVSGVQSPPCPPFLLSSSVSFRSTLSARRSSCAETLLQLALFSEAARHRSRNSLAVGQLLPSD